jgi:hypothetical protein
MKTAVFWVVAPDYTVLQPRRQQSSGTNNVIQEQAKVLGQQKNVMNVLHKSSVHLVQK